MYFCGIMDCKFTKKATELFTKLGFKSVTMDDIAQESGVSKKTIYQHFKNKTELIQFCVNEAMQQISAGICAIKEQKLNAVEEQLMVKEVILEQVKSEKSSPHLQLQRYYPSIYKNTRKEHFTMVYKSVYENIERGIAEGLYRENLNIDVITRMHFICALELKNQDIFPAEEYSIKDIMNTYIENYLRSIVTAKGLAILEHHTQTQ